MICTKHVCRIAAARQSIPECAAAADSLNNSHTSLAMLSHQLLQQRSADPAQPSQADPQEANKPPYQCSDKAQDAQQLLHQTRIGPASLRSDASASHPSAAFLLARHKPGPASVQLGSNQTDAIPAAGHAAQAAAARNCAELVQPPAASAQEATASQSTVVVPPWECTGPAACADAGHPSEVQCLTCSAV